MSTHPTRRQERFTLKSPFALVNDGGISCWKAFYQSKYGTKRYYYGIKLRRTEQKNPKSLRSLQNAQRDTTNFAIILSSVRMALLLNIIFRC